MIDTENLPYTNAYVNDKVFLEYSLHINNSILLVVSLSINAYFCHSSRDSLQDIAFVIAITLTRLELFKLRSDSLSI